MYRVMTKQEYDVYSYDTSVVSYRQDDNEYYACKVFLQCPICSNKEYIKETEGLYHLTCDTCKNESLHSCTTYTVFKSFSNHRAI